MATSNPDKQVAEIEKCFINLVSCDEEHRFFASYQFPFIRSIFLKIGLLWTDKKLTDSPQYIFFFTLEEVVSLQKKLVRDENIELKEIEILLEKRKSYSQGKMKDSLSNGQMEQVENIFYQSREVENETDTFQMSSQWTGIVVHSGNVQGHAFWVKDYASLARCPANRIVLCQTPSPNFHSAFVNAIGIVSETGGVLSHGAILARELKIPCLLQVPHLKSLKNDDWIELNATQGILKRLQ